MRGQSGGVHADAAFFDGREHRRQGQVDVVVNRQQILRFDFAAEQRREALQLVGGFAGGAGKRDVEMAQRERGKFVLRGGGPQEKGVQHGGVDDAGNRAGEQLGELGIVNDLGARGIAQEIGESGEHFAFGVAPGEARYAGLRRKLETGNARAETGGFAFARIEREPDSDWAIRWLRRQKFAHVAGRFEQGVIASGGRRGGRASGKFAQQRPETQLGVERAQGWNIRFATGEARRDRVRPGRRRRWWRAGGRA